MRQREIARLGQYLDKEVIVGYGRMLPVPGTILTTESRRGNMYYLADDALGLRTNDGDYMLPLKGRESVKRVVMVQ